MLCIVYISEASRFSISNAIKKIALNQSSCLVHLFEDKIYNRSSYYFMGGDMKLTVKNLSDFAYNNIDFHLHHGNHPTLGTIDHISFTTLDSKLISIEKVAEFAKEFSIEYSDYHKIPVFAYGLASSFLPPRSLKDIRKSLNYFNKNTISYSTALDSFPCDYGLLQIDGKKGITCIGAVPFVLNYNMRFRKTDLKEKVMEITKDIRSDKVECLTLPHENGSYEVACNLLDYQSTGPNEVYDRANRKADLIDIEIQSSYTTCPMPMKLLEIYQNMSIYKNERL